MADKERKIGVMGDKESIAAFGALGLALAPVDSEEAAEAVLEKWAGEDFAVIFVTEDLARKMGARLDAWRLSYLPVVTLIPSARQAPYLGRQELRTAIRKATGIDMIGQRDKARKEREEE